MTEDFLEWAGLTPQRWEELQDRLRNWIKTERTPTRIMKAMLEDQNLGYREQVILSYWLGYCHSQMKPPMQTHAKKCLLTSRLT